MSGSAEFCDNPETYPRWMRARPSGNVHWIVAKDTGHPVFLVPLPACGRGSCALGFTDDFPPLARRCGLCEFVASRSPAALGAVPDEEETDA